MTIYLVKRRAISDSDAIAIRHAQQLLLLRLLVALASIVTALAAVIVAFLVALAEHVKLF